MLTTEWILGSAFVQWGLIGATAVSFLSLFGIASLGSTTIDRFADNQARRILANSATPLAAQLLNRFVDLIFAAIALRILGVEGNGQYAIATVTWLYLKTMSDFGLSILVAREVAKHPESAGRLVGTTTLFRLFVLTLLLPILISFLVLGSYWLNLSHPSVLAILLLTFSIIPASYAEAINSVFTGAERLHLPAILTVFTNLIRFSLGLLALGQGFGVPGIAGAAVLATLCNAAALHIAVQRQNVRILWEFSATEAKALTQTAWPLLLNGLLITVFFRIDTFVIQGFAGTRALGIYDAAYKLPNLLPLLPSYFVLAIFPLLSRQSGSDLRRTFELGAKFLVVIAWLIVLVTLFAAPLFIRILGGRAFLPDAADTLRILIWFAPLHYLNGIAQYAVIAANRQREIAPAYAVATTFNVVANLIGVPLFGYRAAAVVTVLTEIVLFSFLRRSLQRGLGAIDWKSLLLRPFVAFTVAYLGSLVVPGLLWLSIPFAVLLYIIALRLTGTIRNEELALLRPLLPRSSSSRLQP
ncbi:flippase [Thermomicrobium sp. CFH 73360]|uniref:flippase n=1 Tax=Thermomicrobium sp. CFH 73360 TaxID=2951987 RepID=UPI002076EB31|nr:flippase [Thermomicrobium sp. CFH 73360]MCM8746736.1 flippase [Thermomicrobium sp. CFH 73360]